MVKTEYMNCRLWLPRRINGKWHWLTCVTRVEERWSITIGGVVVPYTKVYYKI